MAGNLIRDEEAFSMALGTLWVAPAVGFLASGYSIVVPLASFATAYYFYDGTATGLLTSYATAASVFATGFDLFILPKLINSIKSDETAALGWMERFLASVWKGL